MGDLVVGFECFVTKLLKIFAIIVVVFSYEKPLVYVFVSVFLNNVKVIAFFIYF